jgi:hypothetical protein
MSPIGSPRNSCATYLYLLTPSIPTKNGPHVVSGPAATEPVIVNFWEYNKFCARTNVEGLAAALEAHEYAHFQLVNAVAGNPDNDPKAAIEDIVRGESSDAHLAVKNSLVPIRNRIEASFVEPVTLWTSEFWVWDSGSGGFKLMNITA